MKKKNIGQPLKSKFGSENMRIYRDIYYLEEKQKPNKQKKNTDGTGSYTEIHAL